MKVKWDNPKYLQNNHVKFKGDRINGSQDIELTSFWVAILENAFSCIAQPPTPLKKGCVSKMAAASHFVFNGFFLKVYLKNHYVKIECNT